MYLKCLKIRDFFYCRCGQPPDNNLDINDTNKTVKHIKKVKFFLENEAENRPFTFSLKFNINRNKVILKKITPALNTQIK